MWELQPVTKLGLCSQFLNHVQSVELLGRGISPSHWTAQTE
jgi:hypothetical protein